MHVYISRILLQYSMLAMAHLIVTGMFWSFFFYLRQKVLFLMYSLMLPFSLQVYRCPASFHRDVLMEYWDQRKSDPENKSISVCQTYVKIFLTGGRNQLKYGIGRFVSSIRSHKVYCKTSTDQYHYWMCTNTANIQNFSCQFCFVTKDVMLHDL
jgi:hypothetical protein